APDNSLKSGFCGGNLFHVMSLAELKDNVLALPEIERHDFVVWLNRLEQNYGDVPGETLAELAAEIWDQDDRHAPPTHPAP
ncbi:MAG TPA: hypothetical protein VGR14_18295, partial [Verrucomicrobiae bacterium]|nr:hypothetical protein [Verrucomicrobiae bacterium]